ncbi:2638_t:CDS:2 [Scutellospora calospora]|uniref:2638_t:CDS:1 n=1 Tax=Scutellospora calospora TaxID=85575 RepID=A0ACA9K326_9GLOM|nr:2638_t:CDS:2 [Scutellospora calospora]
MFYLDNNDVRNLYIENRLLFKGNHFNCIIYVTIVGMQKNNDRRNLLYIEKDAPRYYTRAMRINYLCFCDLLLPKAKILSLRTIYRMLTGDVSVADTTNQTKVDEQVRTALDLRNSEIAIDLCEHNTRRLSKYDAFWEIAAQFLEGKAANAVTAIKKECISEIAISSAQWLRLQFWLKNLTWLSSLQFTSCLPLKFIVQTCQLHAFYPDIHYASALFRYEKKFAMKFHEITNFIFMDDKYHCKVGEPGFPVAAIEREKKVVVNRNTIFAVADHDYTKMGIISSITMICNIPEFINADFYVGKVCIGLKDLIFQPSLPLRHVTKLYNILLTKELTDKSILCLYIDGSPDHCCTYTHVQLLYICLFLALDLDYFVAVRTPPYHS